MPQGFTARTDHRFPRHDIGISGSDLYDLIDLYDLLDLYNLFDLYDLVRVSAWEPYILHDLGRVRWVGSVLHRQICPSQYTILAGQELDDSSVDRDLSVDD